MQVQLFIFADDLEALGLALEGRGGIVLSSAYFSTLGFSFKWAKVNLGFSFSKRAQ